MDSFARTTRRRSTALLVTLALAFVAPATRAEPTAVERETARTLLLEGREKRKKGDLKAAIIDFEKAHRIMRVPTTGLDLGKAQRDLGLLVEARTSFVEAAQYPEKPNEPQAFKRARREAKQLAEEIAPRLATLTITTSNNAQLKMDDVELSSSSIGVPLKVNPGRHEIVASLNGEEQRRTVDIPEGKSESVELVFAGAPPPDKPGPEDTTDTGATSSKTKKDALAETKTNPMVWVGAGTAAVGVGVGAVTGIMAFGVKSDVTSRCEGGTLCPPATHADIDRGELLATISTVAFVVGGIGAGLMIYGLLNPTRVAPASSTESASFRVRWSPAGLSGTF